jgi:hypothetical protein
MGATYEDAIEHLHWCNATGHPDPMLATIRFINTFGDEATKVRLIEAVQKGVGRGRG